MFKFCWFVIEYGIVGIKFFYLKFKQTEHMISPNDSLDHNCSWEMKYYKIDFLLAKKVNKKYSSNNKVKAMAISWYYSNHNGMFIFWEYRGII